MELTEREIIHVNMAIDNILESGMKLKFQTAYELLKIRRELEDIEEYIAQRLKMVGLICDKSGMSDENRLSFENEILRSVINVDINKIPHEELGSDDNLFVSLDELEKLRPILS